MTSLSIHFYSDFICPWCYIAKVRLDKLKQTLAPEIDLLINIKPYILYPHIPAGGVPKSDFAKRSKPGMGRSLRAEAKSENISFNYKKIDTIPSSLEAHRLVWLVQNVDQKYDLSMKIFHAYFEEGQNIEDLLLLSKLAQDCGINDSVINAFSLSEEGRQDCLDSIAEARDDYINLVPTLEINPSLRLLGLQSTDVWNNYLRRAARMSN